jgi:hypothetical protein
MVPHIVPVNDQRPDKRPVRRLIPFIYRRSGAFDQRRGTRTGQPSAVSYTLRPKAYASTYVRTICMEHAFYPDIMHVASPVNFLTISNMPFIINVLHEIMYLIISIAARLVWLRPVTHSSAPPAAGSLSSPAGPVRRRSPAISPCRARLFRALRYRPLSGSSRWHG